MCCWLDAASLASRHSLGRVTGTWHSRQPWRAVARGIRRAAGRKHPSTAPPSKSNCNQSRPQQAQLNSNTNDRVLREQASQETNVQSAYGTCVPGIRCAHRERPSAAHQTAAPPLPLAGCRAGVCQAAGMTAGRAQTVCEETASAATCVGLLLRQALPQTVPHAVMGTAHTTEACMLGHDSTTPTSTPHRSMCRKSLVESAPGEQAVLQSNSTSCGCAPNTPRRPRCGTTGHVSGHASHTHGCCHLCAGELSCSNTHTHTNMHAMTRTQGCPRRNGQRQPDLGARPLFSVPATSAAAGEATATTPSKHSPTHAHAHTRNAALC